MATALITGATAGIGLSFARELASRGYDIVLVARDVQRLQETAAHLRTAYDVDTEVLPADLTNRDQLGTVEARLADPNRPIDLLVSNAGFGLKKPFLVNSVEAEQQMLDVLVVAVMRLMHAALGPMSARGSGAIINVSSVAGYLPRGTYSAAKAYVTSLSRWAHTEYAGKGVRVMALCPGFVKTEFHERMQVSRKSAPGFMWLDADRLVRDALDDLDANKSVSVPSALYKTIVGASRFVPFDSIHRFQRIGRR